MFETLVGVVYCAPFVLLLNSNYQNLFNSIYLEMETPTIIKLGKYLCIYSTELPIQGNRRRRSPAKSFHLRVGAHASQGNIGEWDITPILDLVQEGNHQSIPHSSHDEVDLMLYLGWWTNFLPWVAKPSLFNCCFCNLLWKLLQSKPIKGDTGYRNYSPTPQRLNC